MEPTLSPRRSSDLAQYCFFPLKPLFVISFKKQGPKGELARSLPANIAAVQEGDKINVTKLATDLKTYQVRRSRSLPHRHGAVFSGKHRGPVLPQSILALGQG